MSKEMSAKDKAFEKERIKYRHQIRDLESEINKKNKEISELKQQLSEKDIKISEYEDWIERLLSYTEMNKEDLHMLIEDEKKSAELHEKMASLFGIMSKYTTKSSY